MLLPETAQRIGVGPGRQQYIDGESAGMRTVGRPARTGIKARLTVSRNHLELAQDALIVECLDQREGRANSGPIAGVVRRKAMRGTVSSPMPSAATGELALHRKAGHLPAFHGKGGFDDHPPTGRTSTRRARQREQRLRYTGSLPKAVVSFFIRPCREQSLRARVRPCKVSLRTGYRPSPGRLHGRRQSDNSRGGGQFR